MEMVEHVPDPAGILAAIATLVRPGGAVFVSTLNRTPKSFAQAILAAEYLLRLIPRGTHQVRAADPSLGAGALGAGCGADAAGCERPEF